MHVGKIWKLYVTMAALAIVVLPSYASIPLAFQETSECAPGRPSATDGAGNTVRYAYDALDRLVARDAFSQEGHERHETFAYDAVGNLIAASNEAARLSFTYDVMDRLATATTVLSNATFTAAYARDAGGLVTNLVYVPGKIVARTYDADGRLVTNQTARWSGSARRCPAAGPRCACRRIRAGGSFQAPPPARHRTRCRSAGRPAARRSARLRRPTRP